MKKFTLGLSLAALTMAGTAYAQDAGTRPSPDADGNGVVTRAEAQAFASQMFTRLDVNNDGQIDEADREARRQQRRSEMFAKLDVDGDGQISRAEYMGFERDRDGDRRGKRGMRGGHRGGHHGMKMMRSADTDNDGAISQDEFTAAALQHFDRMDANSDGQVTQEERKAAREEMRGKWRQMKDARNAN